MTAEPSRSPVHVPVPTASLDVGGAGAWCALRPAWTCIDPATARRWWPASQRPDPPSGTPYTYLGYGRQGAAVDRAPSPERASTLYLVLHGRAETPHNHRRSALVRKGAVVVSVRIADRPSEGEVSPSAKPVEVHGHAAYLVQSKAADDDFPVRLVVWIERAGGRSYVWTSFDSQRFRSDEELVATLNSLGRS